jgi:ketosteroid isomerase-like protein
MAIHGKRLASARAAVVRRYYQHIDAGDVRSALSCFAPDAVYRRPGYASLTGRPAIEDYYRTTRVIGRGRHALEAVTEGPDEVAVRGSFEGMAHDGRPLAVRFADFWRFSDGLVIERNTYFDAAAV